MIPESVASQRTAPTSESEARGSLEYGLRVLRRRALAIGIFAALAAAAAFGLAHSKPKQYTATAALIFSDNQLSQQVAGLQALNNSNPQSQQDTNVQLVQLGDMAAKTANQIGEGETSAAVKAVVTASAQGDTSVVNVSATSTSPTRAARIANTYSSVFVQEQQNNDQAYYRSALTLVRRQLAALSPAERESAAGLALQSREQSLAILAQPELQSGTVQVAQFASVPTAPSSPKIVEDTIAGALLGLLLAVGIAFLADRLNRRINQAEELADIYGAPLLAAIPNSSWLERSRAGGNAGEPLPPTEREAFQMLRARLRYFNVDRTVNVLMVVSAEPGDGKTTVARHLAAAAVSSGSRAILIEVDLRRPTIGGQSTAGLADVLIGRASLDSAITQSPVDSGKRARTLDVLPAGPVLPPNPAELIESQKMKAIMSEARERYDVVVIDTPPLEVVSDAFPLLGLVDGVIVVGRLGRANRDIAAWLNQTLRESDAPVLGVVANGTAGTARSTYYYKSNYYDSDVSEMSAEATPLVEAGPVD